MDLAEVLSQIQRPALIDGCTGCCAPAADPQRPGTTPLLDQLLQLTRPRSKDSEHACIGRLRIEKIRFLLIHVDTTDKV